MPQTVRFTVVEHSCKIKTEIKTTVVNCSSKQTEPNAKPVHSSEFRNLGDSAPENLSLRLAFLVLKEKVLKTHLHLTSLRDPDQSLANPWRRQPQSESLSLLRFLCFKFTCALLKKKKRRCLQASPPLWSQEWPWFLLGP